MTALELEIDCAEVVATHRIEQFRHYQDAQIQECDDLAVSDPVKSQRLWNLYCSENYYKWRQLPIPASLIAIRKELES